jgi:hypothetical protein
MTLAACKRSFNIDTTVNLYSCRVFSKLSSLFEGLYLANVGGGPEMTLKACERSYDRDTAGNLTLEIQVPWK